MRDEQPGWTTMCRENRQALVSSRDHALTVNKVRHRNVCCVSYLTISQDVGRGCVRPIRRLQQIVKCHTLPRGIELRPFSDAVNVRLDHGLREPFELCPIPFAKQVSAPLKGKSPVFE